MCEHLTIHAPVDVHHRCANNDSWLPYLHKVGHQLQFHMGFVQEWDIASIRMLAIVGFVGQSNCRTPTQLSPTEVNTRHFVWHKSVFARLRLLDLLVSPTVGLLHNYPWERLIPTILFDTVSIRSSHGCHCWICWSVLHNYLWHVTVMPAVPRHARAWHSIEELEAMMDQVGCSQKLRMLK